MGGALCGKANPHPELLQALVRAGGRFDIASAGEVELCRAAGVSAADLISVESATKRRTSVKFGRAESDLAGLLRHADAGGLDAAASWSSGQHAERGLPG